MKRKKDIVIPPEAEKMTIYEYEQKYSKRQNVRGAKILLRFLAAAIGVIIAACLILISLKAVELFTDKNVRLGVGIGAGVASVIIFICLYIIPLVKILKSDYFITNVNAKTARDMRKNTLYT